MSATKLVTDDRDDPLPTAEEEQKFVADKLATLGFTQSQLARRLGELGDTRSLSSAVRSIQRAAAGETRLSPELRVILGMLERDWRRAAAFAARATWTEQPSGTLYTAARDFDIYLLSQNRGRWKIHLAHQKTKYSPSWIEWQDTLEIAKIRAFIQLDDTWLDECWQGSL